MSIGGCLIYSKFWRRMAALCVDFIVLSPLFVVSMVGDGNFRLFKIYWFLPVNIFYAFYYIYLPYRFGGTPGKRILGLRMLRVNGDPLKYREVILRFLTFWLPGVGVSVAGMMAVWESSQTDAHTFYGIPPFVAYSQPNGIGTYNLKVPTGFNNTTPGFNGIILVSKCI